MSDDWKQQATALAIIYRILEKGEDLVAIAQQSAALEPAIRQMVDHGYLAHEPGGLWVVTQKGKDLRRQMVGMYDQLLKFEIFGAVDVTRALTPEESREDDPNSAMDNLGDPRFAESPNARDLRLAMIQFMTDAMKGAGQLKGSVDLYLVVFMQKLADGELQADGFWEKLSDGTFFGQIERIVDSADKWTSFGSSDQESSEVANLVYRAGMLEARKRGGCTCSECGSYLALYQDAAKEAGTPFDTCPCGASFNPPPTTPGYQCPNCQSAISSTDRSCQGCGALIDFSQPAGTVIDETITTTTTTYRPVTVWGGTYGYVPYGYYNPYDPFTNAVALSLLCLALW